MCFARRRLPITITITVKVLTALGRLIDCSINLAEQCQTRISENRASSKTKKINLRLLNNNTSKKLVPSTKIYTRNSSFRTCVITTNLAVSKPFWLSNSWKTKVTAVWVWSIILHQVTTIGEILESCLKGRHRTSRTIWGIRLETVAASS